MISIAKEFRELGARWGGEEWQRPLARALKAAGLLNGEYADVTVRRYATGARVPSDEIMDWLRKHADVSAHWIIGKTDAGQRAVAHLTKPRFYALIEKGVLSRVVWMDREPDRRTGGKLLAKAAEMAS